MPGSRPWGQGQNGYRTRVLIIVVIALGILAVGASAAGKLPVAPISHSATAAQHGLKIKPGEIVYAGDATGLLAGSNASSHSSAIHWTKWTSTLALGTGFNQLNSCNPSCAGGTFYGYG